MKLILQFDRVLTSSLFVVSILKSTHPHPILILISAGLYGFFSLIQVAVMFIELVKYLNFVAFGVQLGTSLQSASDQFLGSVISFFLYYGIKKAPPVAAYVLVSIPILAFSNIVLAWYINRKLKKANIDLDKPM